MARGSLSFGYFSLAAQRKVTRRQGGTPTKKVKPNATSEGLQHKNEDTKAK